MGGQVIAWLFNRPKTDLSLDDIKSSWCLTGEDRSFKYGK